MRRRQQKRLRIVITSGPTREPIDPVRFISNYSTGYLGARLATEALARGHRVTVISGPSTEPLPRAARVIPVEQARQMERALRRYGRQADAVLMAAAISDFRPVRTSSIKLPRLPGPSRARGSASAGRDVLLRLTSTPDIIARFPRRQHQLVVGFALETDHVVSRARQKLLEKRLDLLLVQDARRSRPFGSRQVHAWLLQRHGSRGAATVTSVGRLSKPRVARLLLDKIEALWYGQSGRSHRDDGMPAG